MYAWGKESLEGPGFNHHWSTTAGGLLLWAGHASFKFLLMAPSKLADQGHIFHPPPSVASVCVCVPNNVRDVWPFQKFGVGGWAGGEFCSGKLSFNIIQLGGKKRIELVEKRPND